MADKVHLNVYQLMDATGMSLSYLSRISGLSRTTLTSMKPPGMIKKSTAATLLNSVFNDRLSLGASSFVMAQSQALGIQLQKDENSDFRNVCQELIGMRREIEKYSNKDKSTLNSMAVIQGQYDKWRVLAFHLLLIQEQLIEHADSLWEKPISGQIPPDDYPRNKKYEDIFGAIRIQRLLLSKATEEASDPI
ncbi:MAG: hypothetical protein RLO80_12285 [Hyphomonas sp.]